MISNFFVLSPRGDTILAKQYRLNDHILRGDAKEIGAHERSHTEAFFRKIKFWDDMTAGGGDADDDVLAGTNSNGLATATNNGINNAASSDDINGLMTTTTTNGKNGHQQDKSKQKYDAPPVFPMPDGYTYFHIKRNGLIFGASSVRNASPNTVLEVST
jgi:hypothetical protein